MNQNKKVIWGIVIAVIVIVVIALAVSKGNKQSDTVKIGGIYIQTGVAASVGELQEQATKLAVEKVNNSGGVNGRTLEVVRGDSAYESKTTLSTYNAQKLQGIRLFITDGSSPAAAIRKPAIDDGNFVMVPAATTPAYFDGLNRTCRLALTAKSFGPGLADLLKKDSYKTASLLLPANEYGKGLAEEFTKAFGANGGKVIVSEFYDATPSGGDYRTNLTKIKAEQANADVLIFVQTGGTIESMIKQIHDLGWSKPVVSDFYTMENPALKNLALANGMQYVTYQYSAKPQETDSEAVKEFKAEYFKRFNRYPIYTAAATYDSILLISDAVAHVGDDPQKVADYISTLKDRTLITGTVSFNSDCEVDRTVSFAKVENGEIVNMK